jgi:hypothetical protein
MVVLALNSGIGSIGSEGSENVLTLDSIKNYRNATSTKKPLKTAPQRPLLA